MLLQNKDRHGQLAGDVRLVYDGGRGQQDGRHNAPSRNHSIEGQDDNNRGEVHRWRGLFLHDPPRVRG